MVSIPPSWSKFAQLGGPAAQKKPGKSARELSERYHKMQEELAIKTAEDEGYFLTLDNDDLVDHFCEERHRAFRSVHYIRHLNLNSMRIRDISCLSFAMRLRVCNLSGNYLVKLDPLGTCRQLVKLDVHSNQITTIPNHHFWSGMKNLKILHLHDNPISKMETLQHLSNCKKLQILTLHDTPLYLRKNYRHHAVNTIWSLLFLDRHLVSDEEIIEDANFTGKFKSLSPEMEMDVVTTPERGSTYADEMKEVRGVLGRVNSKLAHRSPVLIIQRWYRGFTTRKQYAFVMETKIWAATLIQQWWRRLKGVATQAPPPSRAKTSTPKPRLNTPQRASPPRPQITINLNKLNMSAIEPISEQLNALDSQLPTYRTEPRMVPTPKQRDTPRKPLVTFPYLNPYGSLEVAEIGDLPKVHFRLSGLKSDIYLGEATNQMLALRLISGEHVRDADTEYHRKKLIEKPVKVQKHKFLNNDQRHFSRVQGTMNLSCMLAVNKAYQERDKAEVNLAKMEKIMMMREDRLAARRRVEASKEEKRRRAIVEHQRDKLRAVETLEQQQLHNLHYLYKAQEIRERAQYFKQTVHKENSFAAEFQNQQTSISNALLRHDRQNSVETRQKSLVEFVTRHRDDELEQQDLIKKYLGHRQTMRQAEITLTNAALDSRLLQESSDRIQQAHARVEQLRELRRRAKFYCTLPEDRIQTLPSEGGSERLYGLDKWNTVVGVTRGRVGKHHVSLKSA